MIFIPVLLTIVAFCYWKGSQKFASRFLYRIPRLGLMEEEKPPVSVGGLTLPDILVLSIQALTSSLLPLSVYMMPVTMVSGKRGNTFRLTSTKIWKGRNPVSIIALFSAITIFH